MIYKLIKSISNKFNNKIVRNKLKKLNRNLIGKNLKIYGQPIIIQVHDTRIVIENNVTLNSNKENYHLNMHSPCKLLLDRPGATIKIGTNTRIHGTCIHAYESIVIGENCLIAANTQIFDGNGHDLSFENVMNRINTRGSVKPVFIEDNVWIGTNVVVLPGVRIGYGSVISANSVVYKDIPPMCVAGGNPAKVLKQY
jgi:acetyltransferase-like isoleucine patch superfamily enzyme